MEISSSYVLSRLAMMHWAIHPRMFDVFTAVLNNKFKGELITDTTVIGADTERVTVYNKVGNKAIIPMHGVVMEKTMGMNGMSGFVTTVDLEKSIHDALDDREVEEIIFDINSPGGSVSGTKAVADLIYESRGKKPFVAYANGLMASAAYWIGSAADEIYSDPTADVGSIGVYMMHVDQSKFNEDQGIEVSFIKAGKYKTLGNSHEPLSDLAKETFQEQVDFIYSLFIDDVARNRGVSTKDVANNMAEGRIFIGEQAKEAGLVDGIVSIDDVIGLSKDESYSFLKGEAMLGTRVKDATAENIKAENEKVHDEIFQAGVNSVEVKDEEVKALEEKVTQLEGNMKILENAAKVGLVDEGKKLIEEGKSVEEALSSLLVLSSENKSISTDHSAFVESAPDAAGDATSEDVSDKDEPKTQEEAVAICKKKYNCSKAESWRKAKVDFPNLFNAGFNTHTQNEERA